MTATDLTISDEAIEQNATDLEKTLFGGEKFVTVEIQVLQKTYDKMLAAIERQGWQPEGGLRIMLTLGLGYLEGQRLLESGDAAKDRLLNTVLNLESIAAVMKYHAYDYMRDNKTMEMRMRAMQNMVKEFEKAVGRLRAENEALRAELEQARSGGQGSATETGETAGSSQAISRSIDRPFRRRRG